MPKPSRWAGRKYCTPACYRGAAAVHRLRSNLQAAEIAGDDDSVQIERGYLAVAMSRVRWQRARDLGRGPKLRSSLGRLS